MNPAGGKESGTPLGHANENTKNPARWRGSSAIDNPSLRLIGLGGETASAAFPLVDHLRAFLAGSDSVAVPIEDFL